MRSKWTLVTGASGFIGSTLVRRLVERGEKVKAFVRPGSDLTGLMGISPDRMQLAYGDVMVRDTVYRALAGCDRLYHVAAVFKFTSRRPGEIVQPTVDGTRAVFEAVSQRDVERIVVTSSVAALGVTKGDEPMNEEHPFRLTDPEVYIRAKSEQLAVVDEYVGRGLPIVTVMPASVFGPGDRRPTANGRALVEYLKLGPGRRLPVTDGGICVVDVDDVVEGHRLAMERGRTGERYILGGENLTYRQILSLLHELTGLAEPGGTPSPTVLRLVGWAMERFSDDEPLLTTRMVRDYAWGRMWVTSAKAERELGYTHRPARETLSRAIRWYLANGYVPRPLASRVRLELRPV
ncbi:MAG TPA: NAD-dependent epimerase/dehydratase family protein [Polyangiaceae bacterium]|nr:NAD-dependent epimerase/dehydratase family protein [Polyangiaceae bacterium]